jgi:hypothetical protein
VRETAELALGIAVSADSKRWNRALLSAPQRDVADLCSRVVTALTTSLIMSANFMGGALLPSVSRRGPSLNAGLSGYPFAFRVPLGSLLKPLGAVSPLRPAGESQMQKPSISSGSCRLQSLLLPCGLAIQAAVSSLGHPRPNPFVKGTSRERAAPYVER